MTRLEMPRKGAPRRNHGSSEVREEKPRLFDTSIVGDPQAAMDFITNILESSTEYSVIAEDLTGKILLWNEGARRIYGYEPDEMVGKVNSSILHTPEDVEVGLPTKIMESALRQGKFEGTVSRKRKNGERFTARLVITPRRDAAGKTIGFLLISKDISDEIRMSQYARSLIEASLDPLVTISADGKITDVNEATAKVTGVPRDALIGTDFSSYFTEPDKAQEGYRQVFAKGMVTDYPLTIRHADNRLTDVLYNASVYRDERGNVLCIFAAVRDITSMRTLSGASSRTRWRWRHCAEKRWSSGRIWRNSPPCSRMTSRHRLGPSRHLHASSKWISRKRSSTGTRSSADVGELSVPGDAWTP
jgi:PAS domain S-box-containing protein